MKELGTLLMAIGIIILVVGFSTTCHKQKEPETWNIVIPEEAWESNQRYLDSIKEAQLKEQIEGAIIIYQILQSHD